MIEHPDRDRIVDAIERAWLARAEAGDVGSPRDHAEALADAVIEALRE